MLTLLLAALLAPTPVPVATQEAPVEPPARALLKELTTSPRLAGTVGSEWGAKLVGRWLEAAGFEVEFDEREVMLTYPKRIEIALFEDSVSDAPVFRRVDVFDADAVPPGDVPRFNAWAKSGSVRAEVVDCGRGLRGDFDKLVSEGAKLGGVIALIRYGGSYRGVKVDLATEYGCAGVLLFSDPKLDGPGKGAVWPKGPWKPEWAAQRGSISPMGKAPGDPTTPGFGSPAPGEAPSKPRLTDAEVAAILPSIPCMPIGSDEAEAILSRLSAGGGSLARFSRRKAAEVEIKLDQPLSLRRIINVIATLPGKNSKRVIAGNHRDSWVRGANDAGSGTISLVRAAQRLGERVKSGWQPDHTLQLCFWDAEEFGLIGSTEWVESNLEALRDDAIVYINADAAVGGTQFARLSGTPGLLGSLEGVLTELPSKSFPDENLWQEWNRRLRGREPSLGLPGSGSDFAAFLHHASLPVIDFGLSGASGGQYHTAFDDFAMIDRFIDPGFVGHELAGQILEAFLVHFATEGSSAFDPAQAARAMAGLARRAGEEIDREEVRWLGVERGEKLAAAFADLALAYDSATPEVRAENRIYVALAHDEGIPGRPWFRNALWAPGLETGYSAETLPVLRAAAREGEAKLEQELAAMIATVNELRLRCSANEGE